MLNSRNNLFMFAFPKGFCPDEVSDRYVKYLNRIPGNLITKPIDLLNYSIQSVNFPGTNFDPVSQNGIRGERFYRDSRPMKEIVSNDLSITMQLLDGYINYWMMLDIFTYWYSFLTTDLFIPPGMSLRILDAEGQIVVTTEFINVLYKEISSLEMSFSNNVTDFSTFDISMTYNWIDVKLELD